MRAGAAAALCATRSCHLSIMARAISSARSRGPVMILLGLSTFAGWMDTVHRFRSIPARTVYLIPLYSTGRPLAWTAQDGQSHTGAKPVSKGQMVSSADQAAGRQPRPAI